MNSTTLIPKCSSFMVFNPIEAPPSRRTISGNEALITNSTCGFDGRSVDIQVSVMRGGMNMCLCVSSGRFGHRERLVR